MRSRGRGREARRPREDFGLTDGNLSSVIAPDPRPQALRSASSRPCAASTRIRAGRFADTRMWHPSRGETFRALAAEGRAGAAPRITQRAKRAYFSFQTRSLTERRNICSRIIRGVSPGSVQPHACPVTHRPEPSGGASPARNNSVCLFIASSGTDLRRAFRLAKRMSASTSGGADEDDRRID